MVSTCRPVRLCLGLLAAAVAFPSLASAHAGSDNGPPDDRARGITHADLVRSTDPACRGMYAGARSGVCTHGPDPAPAGVDVTRRRSTAEVVATTPPTFTGTVPGTNVPPTDGTGAVVCDGDGTTGKRIQTLYVTTSTADRYDAIKTTLGQYAINADRQYNASALQNGAARHLRFVTASDGAGGCTLDLPKVIVSSSALSTFDATITAVKALGYNRTDRKYMMWVDANVYCGIGSLYIDSQPGQTNANNGRYAQYARSDNGCWNYAEAHETMHNLGGVQTDAPNATPNAHCSDELDEMCYDDDGSGPVVMRTVCSTSSFSTLFDCNDDDYFHAGTPPTGSYLATHWNTATSAFLINPTMAPVDTTPPAVPTGLAATGGAGSVTLTWTLGNDADLAGYRVLRGGVQIASLGKVSTFTDTGLAGNTSYSYSLQAADTAGNLSAASAAVGATTQAATQTASISGSFSRKVLTASLTRSALAGPSTVVASGSVTSKGNTSPASVTVTLTGPSGQLTTWTGSSISGNYTLPSSGSYTWKISGASGVKYALSVSHQG
jgi:hypothetical protein